MVNLTTAGVRRNMTLVGLLASIGGAHTLNAQCTKPVPARLGFIAGAYVASEIVAVGIRHVDWWPDSIRSFNFSWGGSPSASQDDFLHAGIGYESAQIATLGFDWACVSPTTAGWLGALTGFAVGFPKEIGDGFHGEGFSPSDLLFTAGGATLSGLHRAVPATNAVSLKAFYWPSSEYLNRTGAQPHLESDYAGQRFFMTFSPGLLPGGSGAWPAWLGVAVGHGTPGWVAIFPATHDWYLTLDLNVRGLPIQGSLWRHVATVLDQFHLPLPGLRLRGGSLAAGVY